MTEKNGDSMDGRNGFLSYFGNTPHTSEYRHRHRQTHPLPVIEPNTKLRDWRRAPEKRKISKHEKTAKK